MDKKCISLLLQSIMTGVGCFSNDIDYFHCMILLKYAVMISSSMLGIESKILILWGIWVILLEQLL